MKQIVDVENLHRNMKHVDTISEYKERIIERWVYQNFTNVRLEHRSHYSVLTDKNGMQMKITYKTGKLELEY